MSNIKFIALILFISCFHRNFKAQTWSQVANIGGAPREYAVSFSIGNKGYIGTGWDLANSRADFWEYDPISNNWTQKADFGGGRRGYSAGFSIGSRGYIGLGNSPNGDVNDFWEWDQQTDTWQKKADFPGTPRHDAIAFSIGTKGYMGLGNCNCNDFYEWEGDTLSPNYNTWTQKANFIGGSGTRARAVSFSIGKKGYIATGAVPLLGYRELWEWDGDTASSTYNTWIQRADFGGTGRNAAAGFVIGTKAYIGTGEDRDSLRGDFWEWDQLTDTWTQKIRFGGTSRFNAVGFAIGNKGYIGTGNDRLIFDYKTDVWEYCDACTDVGIKNNHYETNIVLYPNPANNFLYIKSIQHKLEDGEIEICNCYGQTVLIQKYSPLLDVSELLKGIYTLKITTSDRKNYYSKFIKD